MNNLLLLFYEFAKIGLFTFGGGYAMIPMLKDVVTKYNWISLEEFQDFIAVSECTPGSIAINMATYVGFETEGVIGAIVSSIGVILPSFIIILIIACVLKNFTKYRVVKIVMYVLKPITIALILGTGINLSLSVLNVSYSNMNNINYKSIIIFFSLLFILYLYKFIFKKKMNSIIFILLSAVVGIIVSLIFKF